MASKPLRFHPQAAQEYLASLAWYRDCSRIAAVNFESAFEQAAERQISSPALANLLPRFPKIHNFKTEPRAVKVEARLKILDNKKKEQYRRGSPRPMVAREDSQPSRLSKGETLQPCHPERSSCFAPRSSTESKDLLLVRAKMNVERHSHGAACTVRAPERAD